MARKPKSDTRRDGITIRDLWARKGKNGAGNRWLVRVWDPIARDYISKTFPDPDLAVAEGWAEKEKARLVLGQSSAVDCSLEQVGDRYLAFVRDSGVTEDYARSVERSLQALKDGGVRDLKDPNLSARVVRVVKELQAQRKGQKTPTPASSALKRLVLVTAKGLCRWAASNPGLTGLMYDPLAVTRLKLAPAPPKEIFTVEQLRAMVSDAARYLPGKLRRETDAAIASADGDKLAAAKALGVSISGLYARLQTPPDAEEPLWWYVMMGIYLGARPTEIRNATWEMIDWSNLDFKLPATAKGNKTQKARRTPIQPELLAVLESRRHEKGSIVPSSIAGMDDSTLTRAFQRYVRRCLSLELEAVVPGPHALRHCCGSLLIAIRGGASKHFETDMLTAMHLGHSNVKQTQHYADAAPNFKNDVIGWGNQFWLRREPPNLKPANLLSDATQLLTG